MKRLLALLCVILPCMVCMAQGSEPESRIIEAAARMSSIDCDFTQTRHLSIMDQNIVSKGRMSYSKPSKLRWEYLTPQQMAFVIDGADVKVETGGKAADAQQGNRMYREIAKMLMKCISGELLADSRTFGTSVSENGKEIVAVLVPKKGELKKMWSRMVMHFDAKTLNAVKIEIEEAGGDTTVIDFYNTKTKY